MCSSVNTLESLKTSLNNFLLQIGATDRPGWSYKLFLDDLRRGFQFGKKKHFRKKCASNKLNKTTRNPLSSGPEDDNMDSDY